jgi:hypothetical protein
MDRVAKAGLCAGSGRGKTFAMYAGAVICLGGLIFAGIRMMSGRFQDAIPGLFGALFGAGVLGWGAGWIAVAFRDDESSEARQDRDLFYPLIDLSEEGSHGSRRVVFEMLKLNPHRQIPMLRQIRAALTRAQIHHRNRQRAHRLFHQVSRRDQP